MYLSCLLVEDGIRHLFLYQSISVSFSSFTLLCVFQLSRRLSTCARGPAVCLVPRLLSHHSYLPPILSWTTILSCSHYLSYSAHHSHSHNSALRLTIILRTSLPLFTRLPITSVSLTRRTLPGAGTTSPTHPPRILSFPSSD